MISSAPSVRRAIALLLLSMLCALAGFASAADPAKVPVLLTPLPGAVLPNGALPGGKNAEMVWDFSWKPVANATAYTIIVMREGSRIPLVTKELAGTEYRHTGRGYVATKNLKDWKWTVSARVDGVWQEWAELGTFEVEPLKP